ncbi:MAG: shikimate kinase [Actinobacteria bacterium]|nr:shikimate kinase [Actinomycetota bacterium]
MNGAASGRRSSVALVGFMGAGKSRVGMALAHRLRLPFVDTDALIAEQCGSIERLFADRGEACFRSIERDVVVATLENARRFDCVVALGGGAVTSADVRQALQWLPCVVWLTAPVQALFDRATEGGRPLAADEHTFRDLLAERESLYDEVATVRVANGPERTVDAVTDEIVDACGCEASP